MIELWIAGTVAYILIGAIFATAYLRSPRLQKLRAEDFDDENHIAFAFMGLQLLWPAMLSIIFVCLFIWLWVVSIKKVSGYR